MQKVGIGNREEARLDPEPRKAQSAMEYLMTYGWSILIIAVVLAALFELGVFGNANLGPKVPPGSCHVFRPGGVGSTSSINLEGTCSGELPEYVAQFNGKNSAIAVSSMQLPISNSIVADNATVSLWVYINSNDVSNNQPLVGLYTGGNSVRIEQDNTGYSIGTVLSQDENGFGDGETIPEPTKTWIYVVAFMNSTNLKYYINGVYVHLESFPTAYQTSLSTPTLAIGGYSSVGYFNGSIANVQVYNTMLSPASINALYAEGIGGAPINLQNLVGWWPLNGDTNDYSGQYNNGVPTNVIFTSSWTSGYSTT